MLIDSHSTLPDLGRGDAGSAGVTADGAAGRGDAGSAGVTADGTAGRRDSSPGGSGGTAAQRGQDLLRISGLEVTVHDGAAAAVRGVSLSVGAGEIVGLVGESGSGKTLTCRAAIGLLPPGCAIASGTVWFGGREVTALSRRQWQAVHGTSIGAVFQDPASYLTPSVPVGSQLAEVLRVKQRMPRRAARQRALELLAAVGLRQPDRVYRQIPAELSGGMLQRAMIATAISCDPQLLIADEATTALDVTIQAEVIELLLQLRRERGLAVLFVSHDLAVVSELCDRIAVFYAGEVVESGPAPEIVSRPRHPYTQALMRVASVGDMRRRELQVIPGQPPPVGAEVAGCRFAGRCPEVTAACTASAPMVVPIGGQHDVRCVRVGRDVPAGELVTR
jgi:peptide/nickel transport system ATP-binding protein